MNCSIEALARYCWIEAGARCFVVVVRCGRAEKIIIQYAQPTHKHVMFKKILPAALAEAGLEIAFQVGHGQLSLAVEVVTFVHPHRQIWRWR